MPEANGTHPNAADILAKRFANGEINADEYQDLLAVLRTSQSVQVSPPSDSADDLKTKIHRFESSPVGKFFQLVGFAVLAIVIASAAFRFLSNGGGSGSLHVRNVQSSGFWGDIITGEVLNEGAHGNIYVWIEMRGRVYCPRSTYLRHNERQRFQIRCYDMAGATGRFSVMSSRQPTRAIRNSASSL